MFRTAVPLAALAALAAVLGACRYAGTFTCDRDEECQPRGAIGTCQPETGLCSAPDATCASGQRYDESAGGSAGTCVEIPAPPDAPPAFDPTTCPAAFQEVAGLTTSRYHVLPMGPRFAAQMQACEALAPGLAHGAVIESPAEWMALLPFTSSAIHMVGAVQAPMAAAVDAGWIHADGTPVDLGVWGPDEPADGDDNEADHAQQFGGIGADGLRDLPDDPTWPTLCECDGKPVAAMFTAHVAAN